MTQSCPTDGLALAVALLQAGRAGNAVHHATRLVVASPAGFRENTVLALAAGMRGEHRRAARLLLRALRIHFDESMAGNLVSALINQTADRPPTDVGPTLQTILALAPAHPDALSALARQAEAQAEDSGALIWLRRSLRLRPDDTAALHRLGWTAYRQGHHAVALATQERLLTLQPDHPGAELGRAAALLALRHTAPPTGLIHATRLAPLETWIGREAAFALKAAGRSKAALVLFRHLAVLEPGAADAWAWIGEVLCERCSADGAGVALLRRSLSIEPAQPVTHAILLFYLDFLASATVAEQQEERRLWRHRHLPPAAARRTGGHSHDAERRLRVGYVSGDFKRHPVAYALEPVLRHHAPTAVEVVCYQTGDDEDDLTARLRALVPQWRRVARLDDTEFATVVQRDGIDILVDLAGHTRGSRLALFAGRPAPVQVSTWWHASGTGLETIDAFLADPIVIPPPERPLFAERILDLPCFLTWQSPDPLPPVAPPPVLNNDGVTFGCFNRAIKLSPATMATWAAILDAVPGSRLLLASRELAHEDARQDLRDMAHAAGVPDRRLDLQGPLPYRAYLEAYSRIDIALDPFPHAGGITTLEALWMGVPVVALRGSTPAGRLGASICTAAGRPELVADDLDAYCRIAAALAAAPDRLAALRATIRQDLAAAPVGNPRLYTAALEDVYRSLWRAWCGADHRR